MANMINLAQIKGGLELKNALEVLKKSYPASNVTTTDVKSVTYKKAAEGEKSDEEGFLLDEEGKRVVESQETYTAQELLTKLNTSMEELTGGSGKGSIDSRIQDAVKTITDREVFDYVRLWIKDYDVTKPLDLIQLTNGVSEEVVKGNVSNVPTDLSAVTLKQEDLAKMSLGVPFVVYTKEGEPVLDADKKNVTVTFTSDGEGETAVIKASFSATPYEYVTETKVTNVSDEEVTVGADKKTLALANKYVDTSTVVIVDANGATISRRNYFVNSLAGVVEFRREHEENEQFKVTYSFHKYEEVKTEFATKTDAWFKLYPIEKTTFGSLKSDYMVDNVEINNIQISNAVSELEKKLAEETDIVEQIIATVADVSIQNALKAITASLEERLEKVEKAIKVMSSFVTDVFDAPAEGTVDFSLSAVPTAKKVELFINGVRYREGDAFTVDRDTVATTGNKGYQPSAKWLFTATNGGFDLNADYEVVFEYVGDADKVMFSNEGVEVSTQPNNA